MVKNSRGTLSGNTRKLRGRTGLTVADHVRTFKVGAKVIINPRSTSKGQPHMRYCGRHGIIIGQQGKSYVVEVKDGNSKKQIIASSIHLKESGEKKKAARKKAAATKAA